MKLHHCPSCQWHSRFQNGVFWTCEGVGMRSREALLNARPGQSRSDAGIRRIFVKRDTEREMWCFNPNHWEV